jgi:hypothetical protein
MKVYVVTAGSYSDYSIDSIFSTKELAEAYIAEGEKEPYASYNGVDEWEVDELAGNVLRQMWTAYITRDGTLHTNREQKVMANPKARSRAQGLIGDWGFQGESFISQEHAMKLAVEARQKWLRENHQK